MRYAPSDSQKFVLFWVSIVVGTVIGSHISVPTTILLWVGALWLVLLLSGQDERIETVSVGALGISGGLVLWQVTGGETWFPLEALSGLVGWLERLRTAIIDQIFLALPEPHGSLLTGILIGNRAKLDPELLDTFRTVGLTHLIAVSGYNLSVLTSNVRSLLWPLIGRRALFVAAAVIVAFVVLSGAPPSILRAAVMAGSLLLAQFVGRPSRSVNILIFAAGILTVFEPKIVFEIGFQLSVVATYGLVRLGPIVVDWLSRFQRLPESLRLIIGETLAATIATAPLLVLYFDRLSLISPISNILVLPIMPLLMGLGIVGCLFLWIIPSVGEYLIHICWPLLEWIVFSSTKLAALPHATLTTAIADWVVIGAAASMIVAIEVGFFYWRRLSRDSDKFLQMVRA